MLAPYHWRQTRIPQAVVLLASDVAGQHGQQRRTGALAQSQGVVPISATRRLANAKSLVDLVGEESKKVAAAVAVKNPRVAAPPNEKEEYL